MSDEEFAPLSTPRPAPVPNRVAIGLADDQVYRCESLQPLIVFGPQRSGKTTSVVIPALLEWEGPCVVTSVRFDVAAKSLRRRARLGEVFIFDPAGVAEEAGAQFAAYCVGWSPLDSVLTWDDAVRQASSLAEGTDTRGVNNGDFWISQARLLLTALLFAAARAGKNMSDVLNWLGIEPADLIDEFLGTVPGASAEAMSGELTDWSRCIRRLMSFEGYASETFSSIAATVGTMLEVFDLSEVQRRCSLERRLPLDTLLDGGSHTLYMCAPPADQRQFRPLFTALVRQVMHNAIRANSGVDSNGDAVIKVPLMLCLDEAGNIAKLEDLDVLATTAAGSGIQLVSVFHDMSQLYATYDENRGRLIINNHRGKLFLPGNSDPRTGDFLSDQLGSSEVRRKATKGWRSSSLRELKAETALCLYGGMPPTLLGLRRWYQDDHLVRLAGEEGR